MGKQMTLNQKLNTIREIVDIEICDDMDSIIGKGTQLSGIIGLTAECKAQAKKEVEIARLKALDEIRDSGFSPTIMMKALDARCADELAAFTYADRLNAAVTHQMDLLRTIISYRKEEMSNERVNHFAP